MGNIKKPTNKVPLKELLRQLDEEEEPLPEDGTETAFVTFYKKTPKYPQNSALKNMFCTKCGSSVNESALFCGGCGEELKAANSEAAPNGKPFSFWKTYLVVLLVSEGLFLPLLSYVGLSKTDGFDTYVSLGVMVALIDVLITYIVRGVRGVSKEPQSLTPEEIKKYQGIQGWLYVVVLGLIFTSGYGVYDFVDALRYFLKGETSGFVYYAIIQSGALTVFSFYILYLLFKKKRSFKANYISFLIFWAVVQITTLIVVGSASAPGTDTSEYSKNAGRAIVSGLVWGLYIAKSKRVKATFVNED